MKSKYPHFLWPRPRFQFKDFLGSCSTQQLENKFKTMFPSGYPVVCSSGRVALYMAISELNLSRSENVQLFPYASHCVISAVARLTNPVPYHFDTEHQLVYHQWGLDAEVEKIPVIEDSVDSLYEKGTPLFSAGSDFEIWSLSKILGSTSGGILWCKKESDAIRIRKKIKSAKNNFLSGFLRVLSLYSNFFYSLWEGTETGYKSLPVFQRNEINKKIASWEKLVSDRKKKLELFKKLSPYNEKVFKGRLPTCLPIKTLISEKEILKMGFSTGKRIYLMRNELIKVFPLPLHQDVNFLDIEEVMNKIQRHE